MGNCQAIENASLVVKHPCGRVDKLYWPVTACELMKMNPGHHLALLLTTTTVCPPSTTDSNHNNTNPVRVTRIKLLKPTDTLILGHAYKLIPTQEVMRGLRAKEYAKMKKKTQSESGDKQDNFKGRLCSDSETIPIRPPQMEKTKQVLKQDRHRQRTTASVKPAAAKSKSWQPSLRSISEAGS